MVLPAALGDYQTELAGRLVTSDSPGQVVRELRERYAFTQEWLATLLGMRRESLSRVEGGRVNLSLGFVRSFSRIMTLARGVREHLAGLEGRHSPSLSTSPLPPADGQYLEMLTVGLRLDRRIADEVILASTLAYEQKRRDALRQINGRPDPRWQEARPGRLPDTAPHSVTSHVPSIRSVRRSP